MTSRNPARAALTRAVNRAIADGAPILEEIPSMAPPTPSRIIETLIATRDSYEWDDVFAAVIAAKIPIRSWMTVRNAMATVNAAHGWTRDHSSLRLERYVPRSAETTMTTLKLSADLARYLPEPKE